MKNRVLDFIVVATCFVFFFLLMLSGMARNTEFALWFLAN